jgi:hypothetical protein
MGSIAYVGIGLERAAALAPRIVVGRVLEVAAFRFPGSAEHDPQREGESLQFIRIDVVKTLKGSASGSLYIFDPNAWYYHSHARLIRDGVVSFAESHYTGGIQIRELRSGEPALFFLGDSPAPAGFPVGAVFLSFGEAVDRADREGAVVAALEAGAR